MSFKILIVDDEIQALEKAKYILRGDAELDVHTADDAETAIHAVRTDPYGYAAILLDLHMPNKSGIAAARELLSINPDLLIAVSSGDESRKALKECLQAGVADFIEKDSDPEIFRSKIKEFCRKYAEAIQLFRLENPSDENTKLIESIGMKGQSKALAEVAKTVLLAAPTDCGVLIHGESGTGKELVARAIHRNSPRKQKPFVPINVAAIPDTLLESELFGHDRGAFTGADRQKTGKIKAADGGTLFLDEIGEMKPELQAKLLRVLQEGEIHPVGSLQTVRVDVRVVAATHVDLEKAIAEGRFREDLYYRLNVLKIEMPPLRSCPEDIPRLVAHFQKKFGGEKKTIRMKAIRYLERYSWPGNVRELENEMEKLMTVVPSMTIESSHLSAKFFANETKAKNDSEFDCSFGEFMDRLKELERRYYLHHRSKAYSLREAARHRMKAPFGTIYARMRKLGLTDIKENTNG